MPDKLNISQTSDLHQMWAERIDAANRYYKNWADKYKVHDLEQAYYGHQWDVDESSDYQPYTINSIFTAIDVKMPGLLFQNPVYTIKPKPSKLDFNPELEFLRARLKEDVLNQDALSDDVCLAEETELALLNAFFAFGVIEVIFSTDWIENPNAGKPVLSLDRELNPDNEERVVREPEKIPSKEQLVVKRIPSRRFRVSTIDHQKLERCNWYGYWEYVRTADLIANKTFNTKDISLVTGRSEEFNIPEDEENEENSYNELQSARGDVTKLWKLWDTRERKILYYSDNAARILKVRDYSRTAIFPVKYRERLNSWYPLPVVYNWISPQNEQNEIRESARAHRRRMVRKFIAPESAFKQEEMDKLQNGPDGTIAVTSLPDPTKSIIPMPNADLGAQHQQAFTISTNDMDNIAGITSEQRGQRGSRTTATQAQLIDKRSDIRESRDRIIVAKWLQRIGKEMLKQRREKSTLDFWVKVTAQDAEFGELQFLEEQWRLINAKELGDEDFDVQISVTSLSPIENDTEKRKFFEFLAVLNQYPQLALSPQLVMEAADRTGYRNRRVLAVMQKMALAMQMAQIQQADQLLAQASGVQQQADSLNKRQIAQSTPNDLTEITQQLANQGTVVQ